MNIYFHYDTVIFVGGSLVNLNLLKPISKLHPIFAADSGANVLVNEEINFKAVIGDMDSINKEILKNPKIENILISDQNSTDLEKCFSQVKADIFIGFGFLDLRLDHTLASLTAINKEHSAKIIILVGEIDTVVWINGKWSCELPIGTRLSVWPLGEQFFYSSYGLKYSLEGLTLHPLNLIGTSNETTENNFSINPSDKYKSRYVTIIPSQYFLNLYKSLINKKILQT